jgi:hypothetical protein
LWLLHAVGESTEREILAKLMQDAPASNPPIPPEVPDIAKDANDADGAQRNNAAYPSNQSNEADRAQGGIAEHQNVSIKGAQRVQLPEKSVPASNKRNLVERHPNASTYEVTNSLWFYSHYEGYVRVTTYILDEVYQSHIEVSIF